MSAVATLLPDARRRVPWVALGWLAAVLAVVVLADLLSPFSATAMNLRARLAMPALLGGPEAHLLGTDHLGRDVLSRLLYATRVSVTIALAGTLIAAVLGTALGLLAVRFGGWVDDLIMAMVDVQASVPFIIVALTLLAFFGNSMVLLVCILGIHGWERYARLARGLALGALAEGYAVAARSLGASRARVFLRHILPNIGGGLIVQMTLAFPETLLLETSLSFLGLGVQPPMFSLGSMLAYARNYLLDRWWMAVVPGLVIFLTALAISVAGDWLRDRFDSRILAR